MAEYKIKISYSTGNSFGTYDTHDYLELTWHDINVAKENLMRIKEHYDMYEAINGYGSRLTVDELYEKNKDKEWFVSEPKMYYAQQCLKLKTDNGNSMQMSAFWCGYFEHLQCAEIEVSDDGMKITF